jgi:peptide chain release factor 2
VLQPYHLVKDLRPSVERADPQKVLDGDLDELIAASLVARLGQDEKAA